MPHTRYVDLFNRYINDAGLTAAEEEELTAWLANPEHKALVMPMLDRLIKETDAEAKMDAVSAASVFQAIIRSDKPALEPLAPVRSMRTVLLRSLTAAAVIILLAAGVYMLVNKNDAPENDIAFTVPDHIKPGGDKALLTLADGSQIVLDTAHNGVLQSSGNIVIRKTKDGELVYDLTAMAGKKQAAELYNTISTPAGGQYQVLLPDGSRVWLNAASSVRFPMAFTGSERKIDVTGEAYLEVAANAVQPFVVHAGETDIKVLGTAFNVNSYTDERYLKTTLISGSVKVSAGTQHVVLKPGEQALSKAASIDRVADDVNLEETVAWKNGLFYMSEMPVPAIMRQISRWYNVEVQYPDGLPVGTISGKIPRAMSFANVLQVLQKSGVSLHMNGEKLVINP